jgi:diguanylate cyclase (GGDEF)-like protein
MQDLKACYRQGLTARIGALETARRALREKAPDAMATIRRLAHALHGSGGTYGFPEVSEAARLVEMAPESTLDEEVERLLQVLRPIAATDTSKVGILVVEDDPDMARVLEMRLAAPNREVLVAGSATEAESILDEHEVALIILDLVLPDRDGRNVLIRLRERPGTAALPVIVLSGKGRGAPQTECFALGADAYFEKPVDLNTLAAAVATRLQRTGEVSREARQDPLTGLPNRAAFREACERARALALRKREPLSLGILDLDRFKSVNDKHGHAKGDEVLRRAATVIARSLRSSDLLARWGGEEFVVLLPNANQRGAVQCLERALQALRRERFLGADGVEFGVTYSAGVVQYPEGATIEEAVSKADRLLYLAKVAGRNRVLGADEESSPPGSRILLAGGDAGLAAATAEHFGPLGLQVDHIAGAGAAIAAALDGSVALVLLDMKVPALDGALALKELRQSSAFGSVPIIVLADSSSEQDIVRSFELGADDYIVKPFSPAELLARAHRLLKRT